MIPKYENYNDGLEDEDVLDFILETEPSLTYAMRLDEDEAEDCIFVGKTDDTGAVRQAITKILNTERYENEIYSWDYGIELQDLFGMSMIYVMSEIELRIRDALLADDRLADVGEFEVVRTGKRTLHCEFTVITVLGEEIRQEMEMDV